jgi:ERCC4-type nuclease
MDVQSVGWTIIRDSREQDPWLFEGISRRVRGFDIPINIPVAIKGLKTGDYSIEGHEDAITIERKSAADLIGTISRGRERFIKELGRMAEMPHSFVVVEADWLEVLKLCQETTCYNPRSLDASVLAFQLRYPTQWIFRPTRFSAMKTAFKILDLYYRKMADVKREPNPDVERYPSPVD